MDAYINILTDTKTRARLRRFNGMRGLSYHDYLVRSLDLIQKLEHTHPELVKAAQLDDPEAPQ